MLELQNVRNVWEKDLLFTNIEVIVTAGKDVSSPKMAVNESITVLFAEET